MASILYLDSKAYQTRYLSLVCEQVQDIPNNRSVINWTLSAVGGNVNSYSTGATTVTINGTQVYYAPRVSYNSGVFPAMKGSVSGTITIPHSEDGKKTISVSLSTAIYYANVETVSSNWALDTIPRGGIIVAAPWFNDEENPTITYKNYAGSNATTLQACISLTGERDDIVYRDIPKDGTSYTFNLTDSERNILRSATTNGSTSRQITFFIKTVIGSKTFYSTVNRQFTVINAEPTLICSVNDIGGNSTKLTGNSSKMIRGFNVMKCLASATGAKGATIQSYLITCGDKYLASNEGNLTNCESNVFTFKCTDNRGLSTVKTVTLSMIEYIKLTANLKASMEIDEGENAKLPFTITGNCFNASFGAVNNEFIFKYALKANSGSYSDWKTLNAKPTFDGNTYTLSTFLTGIKYDNTYTIKVAAFDKINTSGIESTEIVLKLKPVFDWGENDFNFNVPVKINNIELDYIVEQGSKNGWTYRKWNSGRAECWKIVALTTDAVAWGALFRGSNYISRQTYPFTFTDKPVEQATLQSGTLGAMIVPADSGNGVNGSSASAQYTICRPAATTSAEYYISLYVCGNWK